MSHLFQQLDSQQTWHFWTAEYDIDIKVGSKPLAE